MSITVTLDTNLFLDKAAHRHGAGDFDRIIGLTKSGHVKLYYTGTTDLEDKTGEAMRLIVRLVHEGLLREDPNAGTGFDFIPGSPGLHRVQDKDIDDLVEMIWPNAQLLGRSYESKRGDACHLMAHRLNKRDVFLTKDSELLRKRQLILEKLGVKVMSPQELLGIFNVIDV